jgi:anti-sigma regulatory factor (Ser/Thr protein kinase)
VENAGTVLDFITDELDRNGFPDTGLSDILVAAEEIYLNIANHGYGDEKGDVDIFIHVSDKAFITFEDSGEHFDPSEMEDPDFDIPLMEREIGGLGVYLTKQLMDTVKYEREGDKNILTIMKSK